MKNSIKNIVIKFFVLIFATGLMAGCASIADSGFGPNTQANPQKTTVNSDSSGVKNVKTSGDEGMQPIITPPTDINPK